MFPNHQSVSRLILTAAVALAAGIGAFSAASAAPRDDASRYRQRMPHMSAARVYLQCQGTTYTIQGVGLSEHKVIVRNSSGRTLRAGTRVYFGPHARYGVQPRRMASFTLPHDLPPGASLDRKIGGKLGRCVAWVNPRRPHTR